jgi:hypothetical protein
LAFKQDIETVFKTYIIFGFDAGKIEYFEELDFVVVVGGLFHFDDPFIEYMEVA